MSRDGESRIPSWDGKEGSFGVYANKLKFYAEFVGCGDVLDEIKMRQCPTRSEFETLDPSVTADRVKIDLYKAKSKLCSVIGLGQSTSHGMAFLNITKSSDYPSGLAYKFMQEAMLSYKPSDEGALIELDQELDKIQL